MRYEVLRTLYDSSERCAEMEINAAGFVDQLGVWRAEFYRVIEFLDRHGYIRYLRGGPMVCLTSKGVQYIEKDAGRRKSIREEP